MSEEVTVIYWRDIPAQVISGHGRDAIRAGLPDRFEKAIDQAAARAGLTGADEYTAQLHKVTVPGPTARVVADQLDADYPDTVLDDLVKNQGRRP
jgi:hypothetical protein